jgi:predicted transcriptional regulator
MTLNKDELRQRTALLKKLREERADTIERTRSRLKEQNATRRAICQAMRQGAVTVPEIATASGLLSPQVLWHVTAMKKYDLVVETGRCGEYYQYKLAEEEAS